MGDGEAHPYLHNRILGHLADGISPSQGLPATVGSMTDKVGRLIGGQSTVEIGMTGPLLPLHTVVDEMGTGTAAVVLSPLTMVAATMVRGNKMVDRLDHLGINPRGVAVVVTVGANRRDRVTKITKVSSTPAKVARLVVGMIRGTRGPPVDTHHLHMMAGHLPRIKPAAMTGATEPSTPITTGAVKPPTARMTGVIKRLMDGASKGLLKQTSRTMQPPLLKEGQTLGGLSHHPHRHRTSQVIDLDKQSPPRRLPLPLRMTLGAPVRPPTHPTIRLRVGEKHLLDSLGRMAEIVINNLDGEVVNRGLNGPQVVAVAGAINRRNDLDVTMGTVGVAAVITAMINLGVETVAAATTARGVVIILVAMTTVLAVHGAVTTVAHAMTIVGVATTTMPTLPLGATPMTSLGVVGVVNVPTSSGMAAMTRGKPVLLETPQGTGSHLQVHHARHRVGMIPGERALALNLLH